MGEGVAEDMAHVLIGDTVDRVPPLAFHHDDVEQPEVPHLVRDGGLCQVEHRGEVTVAQWLLRERVEDADTGRVRKRPEKPRDAFHDGER